MNKYSLISILSLYLFGNIGAMKPSDGLPTGKDSSKRPRFEIPGQPVSPSSVTPAAIRQKMSESYTHHKSGSVWRRTEPGALYVYHLNTDMRVNS